MLLHFDLCGRALSLTIRFEALSTFWIEGWIPVKEKEDKAVKQNSKALGILFECKIEETAPSNNSVLNGAEFKL